MLTPISRRMSGVKKMRSEMGAPISDRASKYDHEDLNVVVQRKLQRMRTHSQWIDFAIAFVINPAFD